MTIERDEDLAGLIAAGRVVRRCLMAMTERAGPGVTTAELNEVGAEVMRRNDARSAPMQVYGFPAAVCISVNDEIVHGIPSGRVLEEGDLLKLDVTVENHRVALTRPGPRLGPTPRVAPSQMFGIARRRAGGAASGARPLSVIQPQ